MLKECPPIRTITEELAKWARSEPNVPRSSVDHLLKILKPHLPTLPLSVDTLIPSMKLQYEDMGGGKYVHFANWTKVLRELLTLHNTKSGNYDLKINIDGLPLFKSSPNYKLYPIILLVQNISCRPICAGIYSTEKSTNREIPDPQIFLHKFLKDLKELKLNPIEVNGKVFILSKTIYCCDAPARSALKKIKSHTGYHACERCKVEGYHHDHRVSFYVGYFYKYYRHYPSIFY